mgnify:CR=1 FL=1
MNIKYACAIERPTPKDWLIVAAIWIAGAAIIALTVYVCVVLFDVAKSVDWVSVARLLGAVK